MNRKLVLEAIKQFEEWRKLGWITEEHHKDLVRRARERLENVK